MRIVQLIDSLEAGGSERMAINYANALTSKISFSGLIATRQEGVLKRQLNSNVDYLFLNKRWVVDFKAVFALRAYILKNEVAILHAHSSSFFIAVLTKLIMPKIKIFWHDHHGVSQDLSQRKKNILKLSSLFFNGIISVNAALKKWSVDNLLCKNVVCLPNFSTIIFDEKEKFVLKGNLGKRILCVANLRPQKNHLLLLKVAKELKNEFPDWTFHFLGKDFNDSYSNEIKEKIKTFQLEKTVFLYNSTTAVYAALKQADIAVLSSSSEGLPLSLLEYGNFSLPVIITNVGDVSEVINSESCGIVVEPDNSKDFLKGIKRLITDENLRKELGKNLCKRVKLNFSEENSIQQYLLWIGFLNKNENEK